MMFYKHYTDINIILKSVGNVQDVLSSDKLSKIKGKFKFNK